MMSNNLNNLKQLVPSTRYQGSKRRILPWLYKNLKNLEFQTVLDGFGGTASVSYLFKLMGKKVIYNDILLSNHQTGIALIENDTEKLDKNDLKFILHRNGFEYPSFIRTMFKDIYYLDAENKWLDFVTFNIHKLSHIYDDGIVLKKKRALAFHILFQACLCKRPFNLFHRKNLYLRLADVEREFGNKTTWEKDFSVLFRKFHEEFSQKIFSNGLKNKAICTDLMRIRKRNFDLVYLDPPYTRLNEKSPKDYHALYHFFEGLIDYENWKQKIDFNTKNKRLVRHKNQWNANSLEDNFEHLFKKFQDSIIVVSYGEPGNPSIKTIKELLLQYKSRVKIRKTEYKYKLNHKNGKKMCEVILIGT